MGVEAIMRESLLRHLCPILSLPDMVALHDKAVMWQPEGGNSNPDYRKLTLFLSWNRMETLFMK